MKVVLVAFGAVVVACGGPADDDSSRSGPGANDPSDAGAADAAAADPGTAPVCPGAGKPHIGIGGVDLRAHRVDGAAGLDRGRVKPFSAMAGELPRILGQAPASLNELSTVYGEVPDRWYGEPSGSAMGVYTLHRVAFDGCLTITASAATYAAAPVTATATTECTRWATKAWSRRPEQTEIDACVSLATTGTAGQPDTRRRWAAVCAAVASSAGFLTY